MSPVRVVDVSVILAQHGLDPDADAETLRAALVARGWMVTVEETGIGAGRRSTAQVRRRREGVSARAGTLHEMVRARGRTATSALAFVLAKVLEKEQDR